MGMRLETSSRAVVVRVGVDIALIGGVGYTRPYRWDSTMTSVLMSMPVCPVCQRTVTKGQYLVTECYALIALEELRAHPNTSAWELSQMGSLPYSVMSTALLKALDARWVAAEPEQREAGGKRYRYRALEVPSEDKARHTALIAQYNFSKR